MATTVTPLATPYKIIIDVLNDELIKEIDLYWETIKSDIEIEGFRKGYVPQKIAEEKIGFAQLYRDVIPRIYSKKLLENDLKIIYNEDYKIFGDFSRKGKIRIQSKIYLFPDCIIPDFKSLEIKNDEDIVVTDDDIEKEIKRSQNLHRSEINTTDDYKARRNDFVTIDFSGRAKDGSLIPGASAKGFQLGLGSNTFIPGFEDQLVGCQKDKEYEVSVVFPKDYKQQALAGKHALFDVKVHKIVSYEFPTVSKLVEDHKYKSIEEFKEKIKEQLMKEKKQKAEILYKANVIDALVDASNMGPIPEKCIEQELNIKYNAYLTDLGKKEEDLEDAEQIRNWFISQQWDIIERGIKSTLLIHRIAKDNDIQASEEELKKVLAERYEDKRLVNEVMNNRFKKSSELSKLYNEKTLEFILSQIK